ncbi:MAG: hypothetical protein ACREKH_08775, partial [Candidatus Rokuibacteriota bacterium]
AARGASTEVEELRSELAATQATLAATQAALAELTRRVESLGAATAPALAEGATARIPPVNADSPAVSFVVDAQGRSDTEGEGAEYLLGSAELFISAPIDPFLRGYASINGTTEEGFDVEEAALVTTALPFDTTAKGGRFFADVGRLSHWHDEALPFVDRPPSIDRLIGGESGAEGAEVSWLVPLPFFAQITGGSYNSIGSERREEPDEFGTQPDRSHASNLTWLARPLTYLDLTETASVELGGTFAWRPAEDRRNLYGVDVTFRHEPGTSGFYQGTVLAGEWFWNDEDFVDVALAVDPVTGDPILGSGTFHREGAYAYVESFFGRRYSAGLRFDYSEAPFGDLDLMRTYSAFLTWKPSEFHRLRIQGDHIDLVSPTDNRVTVQWTAFMGSHVHGFQNR